MWQKIVQIPGTPITIYGYGLMLFLAFIASMNLAARRARREKLDPEIVYDLALWLFVGGLLGARAFYVIQYAGVRVKTLYDVVAFWEGGIVLYGSVMGGALAFFLYQRLSRFPMRPMLDVVAPSLALGIAIGRFGCFLNGCCYGDACDLPWAVRFPAHTGPWDSQLDRGLILPTDLHSLPVHPTQLYSVVDGLVLLTLLTAYYPIRRRDGEVMGILMLTYPITRFLIEHLRNDEGVFYAGMTISQCVSVGLLGVALLYWWWLSTRPMTRYADEVEAGPGGTIPAGLLAEQQGA